MKIPVLVSDLMLIGPDGSIALATFKNEAATRRVLAAFQAEKGSKSLILPEGADVGPVPRTATIDAESIAAAKAQGYELDEAALHDTWERVSAADPAVREALGVAAELGATTDSEVKR